MSERKRRKRDEEFGHEYVQPGDNTKFLAHALKSWNLPPLDLDDDKQVEERIVWYFKQCMEDDVKPTVMGLSTALGIHRETLRRWGAGERRGGSQRGGLIQKAYATLNTLWEDYMMNGKINPVSGIFLGKNHFGYTNKQEVQVTPAQPLGEAQALEQIEEKYIAAIPHEEVKLLGDGNEDSENPKI